MESVALLFRIYEIPCRRPHCLTRSSRTPAIEPRMPASRRKHMAKRSPHPHERDALMSAIGARGVSRRSFLRGGSLAALALGSPSLLAACGTKAAKQTTESCVSKDLSSTQKTLNFSNWPEYIDVETKKVNGKKETVIPTLEDFQTQS